jgi:hypothetical protein
MSQKDNVEFIDNKTEEKEYRKINLKGILSGRLGKDVFLTQFPYFVFLAILGIIYITNRYSAEKTMRNDQKLQKELKELRAESLTTAAELTNASRQSQVAKLVEENKLDLKESLVPPKRIKLRK